MPESLNLFAPAKINYYLHILDKRDDGYYNLESLMGFLSIGDDIVISESDAFKYIVSGEFSSHVPEDMEDDLVVRAARLFSEKTGVPLNVQIDIKKNIPSGAGMGGGSSDAATVLKGLNIFFGAKLSEADLCGIGLVLGSELPVCVRGRLTKVSGRGEVLSDPDEQAPSDPMLVVWPNIICSTAHVFSEFQPINTNRTNHLTGVTRSLYSEVDDCLSLLVEQKGCLQAEMNGSGSSCFARFSSDEDLLIAHDRVLKMHPSWWIKKTKTFC